MKILLFGGNGQDTLDAGSGANVMTGGRGDDLYIVRSARDVVRELVSGGADQISTTMRTLSLDAGPYANVEALAYIGNGNFRGTGNAQANAITGGAGQDNLAGGGGQDTLNGQGGDDLLSGGTGADHFAFITGFGADEVTDFADNADTLILAGIAAVTSVADAMTHATQSGADVLFDFGPAGSVLVRDITLAALMDDIVVL